ncbi:MAG: sel1 repeat family protein [Bacteroidales bacterium]|nr:sel1 repeat family protein [Bacteroidales bacterium]
MSETPTKFQIERWYKRGKRAHRGNFKNHYEVAVEWYRKAAEAGHKDAQYELGMCYLRGEGVPKDDYTAYCWFKESGHNGHADGQYLADDMLRVHEMML